MPPAPGTEQRKACAAKKCLEDCRDDFGGLGERKEKYKSWCRGATLKGQISWQAGFRRGCRFRGAKGELGEGF